YTSVEFSAGYFLFTADDWLSAGDDPNQKPIFQSRVLDDLGLLRHTRLDLLERQRRRHSFSSQVVSDCVLNSPWRAAQQIQQRPRSASLGQFEGRALIALLRVPEVNCDVVDTLLIVEETVTVALLTDFETVLFKQFQRESDFLLQ